MTKAIPFLSLLFAVLLSTNTLSAQKYFTRDAKVEFNATADGSPETIEAKHSSGTVVFNQTTGALEASVLIRGFLFERALMQEHFNENYMESDKYPKAVFKGKLSEADANKLGSNGTYSFSVSGKMTMHGKTQEISTKVNFTVKDGNITSSTDFKVALADYDIKIPSVVADKVAKTASVSVEATLAPLRK